MKKLSKLQINPGKIMKNEELVTLRGGYGLSCDEGYLHYWCQCTNGPGLWEACYDDGDEDTKRAINQYCGGEGECRQI